MSANSKNSIHPISSSPQMPVHPHVPPLTGVTITAGSIVGRHFIPDQTILVESALKAQAVMNPSLGVDLKNRVVYHDVDHSSKVSVVSGCGSGHEPSFAGFVGKNLLAAAVTGKFFSSPKTDQIEAMLERVDGGQGIVAVVMNIPGDVANFQKAITTHNIRSEKISRPKTELILVKDDVSVGRINTKETGRSGIAGTVLILKIAGAVAALGAPLPEVVRVSNLAANHLMSVGASLSHVTIPNQHVSDIQSDEYLVTEQLDAHTGVGVHHLPGSTKVEVDLPGIVSKLLRELLDWRDEDRAFLPYSSNDELVLLVNNLGELSGLELSAITLEISQQLEKTYEIKPVHVYSGRFMSSLNELGFSISLLKVVETGLRNGITMLDLLDAPSETLGWPSTIDSMSWRKVSSVEPKQEIANASPKSWEEEEAILSEYPRHLSKTFAT